jgi:hypothetical protein
LPLSPDDQIFGQIIQSGLQKWQKRDQKIFHCNLQVKTTALFLPFTAPKWSLAACFTGPTKPFNAQVVKKRHATLKNHILIKLGPIFKFFYFVPMDLA